MSGGQSGSLWVGRRGGWCVLGVAAAGGAVAAGARGHEAGQTGQAVCLVAGAPSRAVRRRFQAELAGMYADKAVGQPPVPPAQLGLATILQAYTGASDDEVVEATVMDRRWQLVLDCMDRRWRRSRRRRWSAFRVRLITARAGSAAGGAHGGAGRRPGGWPGAAAGGVGFQSLVGGGPGGGHDQSVGPRAAQGLGRVGAPAGVGAGGGHPGAGRPGRRSRVGGVESEGGLGSGLGRSGRPPHALGVVLVALAGWRGWLAGPSRLATGPARSVGGWRRPARSTTRT